MQLTLYTDYSLRVLVYLATAENGATIAEIAERYAISKNHLVKVAHQLGKKGYISTVRGRNGGIALARDPAMVSIGAVVRDMEPHFNLVECFDLDTNRCLLTPQCALRGVLLNAQRAFLAALDGQTLADVTRNRAALGKLFQSAGTSGI